MTSPNEIEPVDICLCKDSHFYFQDPHTLVFKMLSISNTFFISSVDPNFHPFYVKRILPVTKKMANVVGKKTWDLDYKNVLPVINLLDVVSLGYKATVPGHESRATIKIERA